MKETRRWLALETALVEEMRDGPTPDLLARVAAVFGVARQFPKRHPTDRARDFDLALPPFEKCLVGLTAKNLTLRVTQLTTTLGAIGRLVRLRIPKRGAGCHLADDCKNGIVRLTGRELVDRWRSRP